MPSTPLAVRYFPAIAITSAKRSQKRCGVLHIACRVKPGVSSERVGILSVTEEVIELGVSAKAKDGEANKAVIELIAQVLKVPKSDVEVMKGLKSRDKTITVRKPRPDPSGEDLAVLALSILRAAAED